MDPKGSLSCSQEPTTAPYPQPDESSSNLPTYFPKICSIIIPLRTPMFSTLSLFFGFSDGTFVFTSHIIILVVITIAIVCDRLNE
jgi:hypothetical protein